DSICGIKNRLIEITNENYSLSQNSPNPFNPSTNFNFSVGLNGQTTITLYNSYSQKIGVLLNKYLEPGKYKYTFDATEYSSGVYFYKLSSGTYSCVKSMIIQK
ncbi:MAG: T9SS type A sorting domain-containing protein, partial [Candidatus Kapaibacterium sp.]